MRVEINSAACKYCGKPWTEGGVCPECRHKRPVHARLVTPFVYGGPVREMILGLKYSGRVDVLPFFSRAMVWSLHQHALTDADLVIPVPTVFGKFMKRGYNPAGLLANEVGRLLGIPVEHRLLVARPGMGQKGKGREQRLESRRHAFFIRPGWELEGETVLLVDDVVTTGATVRACSKLLKSAGAGKVIALAVAHAG